MHETAETIEKATDRTLSGDRSPAGFWASRNVRIVFAAVLIVAAAALVWDEFFKYRFYAKKFGVVVPGAVYRSGQISQWMFEPTVHKYNIQTVIDLNGIERDNEDQAAEIASARKLNIEHYRFKLSGDGTGDIRQYANVVEVINRCERAGKPVLVHCAAGAQRTGGAVAFYRMLIKRQPTADVYAELSRYGWREGRDLELVPYVNENIGTLARLLVERGVIDSVPNPLPVLGPDKP